MRRQEIEPIVVAGFEVEQMLTPSEVAVLFKVNPKTVTRWATQRRLPFIMTPGGHRRFPRNAVIDLLKHRAESAE